MDKQQVEEDDLDRRSNSELNIKASDPEGKRVRRESKSAIV